jgi:CheY-like chemotaxis protein
MSALTSHPQPLKIFLVENHADTRKYLTLLLESDGHQVSTAATVSEALVGFPESDAELLICDIGLPDGTGCELLPQLRLFHLVYAIALSGFDTPEEQCKSVDAGFRRHFVKPFIPTDLENALAEAAVELQCAS